MMEHQPLRFSRFIRVAVLACCLLVFASCRIGLPNDCTGKCYSSSPQEKTVPIAFRADVSYTDALRGLTALGIQPAIYCGYQSDLDSGNIIQDWVWQPAGQRERFQRDHIIFVAPTAIAAPDWISQAIGLPGASSPSSSAPVICTFARPSGSPVTPQPGAPKVLTSIPVDSHGATYFARVNFSANADYNAALYDISNLGLRLADPCYEYALAKPPPYQPPQPQQIPQTPQTPQVPWPPTWHPMGQQAAYNAHHALVVAPSRLVSATTWRDQLPNLADVTATDTNYQPAC